MNTRNYYLSFLLAGCSVFMLSSCEKDAYDPSKAKVDKTTDLVVPDGFDWAMTRDVTLSMQSPVATSVSVYLDEKCEKLVAELPVEEGKSSMTLTVPSANSDLWIKYPINSGGEETQKVSIQKATTRAAEEWNATTLFPDYVQSGGGSMIEWPKYYQPAKDSYGTIMFEDMWPEKGDYDFNDFVINYKSEASFHYQGEEKAWIIIDMALKLRAIGGELPYRFCIQLGGENTGMTRPEIKREWVTLSDVAITNCEALGCSVELLPNTERPIIALTGFDKLKEKTGGRFYNTENLIGNSGLTPVITFQIKIESGDRDITNLFRGFGAEHAFDYFLQNPKTMREIHFISYCPTELYTNYSADLGDRGAENYYCSNDKFVWALKAPVEMGWAVEKVDIANVYPEFVEWVKRGGQWLEDDSWTDSNRRWYESGRANKDNGWINPAQH